MPIDGSQINRPARPAAWAEDVEPRRPGNQRSPDCWRPQHVSPGGQTPIPAIDDEFCLKAHCPVSLQRGGAGLDPRMAHAHQSGGAVRHRTSGPAPPANSTPIVAVVMRVVPSPAFRCEAGVAREARREARAAALPQFVFGAGAWFWDRGKREAVATPGMPRPARA